MLLKSCRPGGGGAADADGKPYASICVIASWKDLDLMWPMAMATGGVPLARQKEPGGSVRSPIQLMTSLWMPVILSALHPIL